MSPPETLDLQRTTLLVREAQAGKRESLETLFARYLPRARQIAALRLGQRVDTLADSEDIVQEALLKAFDNLKDFQPESVGAFRHWLARIIERALIDHYRRQGAAKRAPANLLRVLAPDTEDLSGLVLVGNGQTPSEILLDKETKEGQRLRLEEALLKLPPHYRELVILCDLCELSAAEAGARLGIPIESTVRSMLTRAHDKLRELTRDG